MQRIGVSAILLVALSVAARAADLPDSRITPGALLPATANQVCTPGYARTRRHVTAAVRRQVFASYGLDGNHTGYCAGRQGCEIDHLVSLELGGSNDPANLWPESYDSQPWNAHRKDRLENALHRLVCSGRLGLGEAQRAISTDWIAAYGRYVGQPVAALVRAPRRPAPR